MNVYNNYGISVPYAEIEVLGNTVAIAYYNRSKDEVTVTMYEL